MGRGCTPIATILLSACGQLDPPSFDSAPVALDAPDIADHLLELVGPELERASTDEEKAKVLTRWIASASVNDPALAADLEAPAHRFGKLPFYGLCGERAWVFERIARRIGLEADILNIYHFGYIGGGHTALHVRYHGAWHFFDATYAGWFEHGGRVLSFEEMVADPGAALDGLQVVPGRDVGPGGLVENERRMRIVYTKESLRGAHVVSDRTNRDTVPFPVRFDARDTPVRIGWPGATPLEVHQHGIELGIAERISLLMNLGIERFAPIFTIDNARVGNGYTLIFHVGSAEGTHLVYRLRAEDAWLDRDRLQFEAPPKQGTVFEIRFIALSEQPRITMSHSLSWGEGVTLEGLDFGEYDVRRP